jgi:hypothetical protein
MVLVPGNDNATAPPPISGTVNAPRIEITPEAEMTPNKFAPVSPLWDETNNATHNAQSEVSIHKGLPERAMRVDIVT